MLYYELYIALVEFNKKQQKIIFKVAVQLF